MKINRISPIPPEFQFRAPWHRATEPHLQLELSRELHRQNPLCRIKTRAVARRQDNDEVLFELMGADAPAAFAVIHLTWSGQPERHPGYPRTTLYSSFSDWVTRCMTPEALAWEGAEEGGSRLAGRG